MLPFHVVGQNVQCNFGADVLERFHRSGSLPSTILSSRRDVRKLRLSPTTKRVIESSAKSQENHIIENRFHTASVSSCLSSVRSFASTKPDPPHHTCGSSGFFTKLSVRVRGRCKHGRSMTAQERSMHRGGGAARVCGLSDVV
jgi:hypothetical protein